MKKVISTLTIILVGIIVLLDLSLFVLGWIQGIYRPLIPAWIILFILGIVAVVYIRDIGSQLDDYDEECEQYKKYNQRLSSELNALRRQIKAHSTQNGDVSQEKTADTDLENSSKDDDSTVASNQPVKTEIVHQPDQEIFHEYYSSPNANGIFDRGYAKPILTDDSFYKISGKLCETHAKVEILKKKDYKRLFDFKSDCLYPVCEIANIRQDGASIIMVDAGCVNLQDNKWIIDSKKKIKINIE